MAARNLLLMVSVLLVITSAARGAQAADVAACAQPGQTRCEGSHQSVCLAQSLRWLRVRDCAAEGLVCAQGDCAPTRTARSARSARAETCDPGTEPMRCSTDCDATHICLNTNVWLTLEQCKEDYLCDEDTFTCKPADQAKCGSKTSCSGLAAKVPNLKNSSQYYDCTNSNKPKTISCGNDTNDYYNACSEQCDYDHDPINNYPQDCTNNMGYSDFMFSNPALYYVCLNDEPLWMRCEKGYFEKQVGECVGSSDYWSTCSMSNQPTTDKSTTTTDKSTTTTASPTGCTQGDKWSVKINECQYYYCYSPGKYQLMRCAKNYKFSTTKKACVSSSGSC